MTTHPSSLMSVATERAAWETGRVQDDEGVVHLTEGNERACGESPSLDISTTRAISCHDCKRIRSAAKWVA